MDSSKLASVLATLERIGGAVAAWEVSRAMHSAGRLPTAEVGDVLRVAVELGMVKRWEGQGRRGERWAFIPKGQREEVRNALHTSESPDEVVDTVVDTVVDEPEVPRPKHSARQGFLSREYRDLHRRRNASLRAHTRGRYRLADGGITTEELRRQQRRAWPR